MRLLWRTLVVVTAVADVVVDSCCRSRRCSLTLSEDVAVVADDPGRRRRLPGGRCTNDSVDPAPFVDVVDAAVWNSVPKMTFSVMNSTAMKRRQHALMLVAVVAAFVVAIAGGTDACRAVMVALH
jgi:hypothetical protein